MANMVGIVLPKIQIENYISLYYTRWVVVDKMLLFLVAVRGADASVCTTSYVFVSPTNRLLLSFLHL